MEFVYLRPAKRKGGFAISTTLREILFLSQRRKDAILFPTPGARQSVPLRSLRCKGRNELIGLNRDQEVPPTIGI